MRTWSRTPKLRSMPPKSDLHQHAQGTRPQFGDDARDLMSMMRMSGRRLLATLGAGALAMLAGIGPGARAQVPGQGPVQGQDGVVKGQHGDWQIVCKPPPPGAKHETCALVQSVTAEDRNNVGLTVYFQRFTNGTQVIRVFAPLGILLPPGLGLKIDNKDVGSAPFLRCHSFACYAQVVADEKLVQQLSTGSSAVFIIYQTEEAGIGIPISLKGFAQALKALPK